MIFLFAVQILALYQEPAEAAAASKGVYVGAAVLKTQALTY